MTFKKNTNVDILQKSSVIYEGEPPANLNIELFYDEDVKFQVESSVELSGTNNITVTGELDGIPVTETISCEGFISEGSSYFDFISSITFTFDTKTNIKIQGITSNGDDNYTNLTTWTNIDARVMDLKWSKTLLEMGVIFEKSKMLYLPIWLSKVKDENKIDNNSIIQYEGDNYSIVSLVKGTKKYELIITRIDD